jgi:hypothetical protein
MRCALFAVHRLFIQIRVLTSRAQKRFDRPPFIHRPVALRHLVQGQGQVEDLARVDLPLPDQVDQLGQEAPYRGGAAVQVYVRAEELPPRDIHIVQHTDEADMTAGPLI